MTNVGTNGYVYSSSSYASGDRNAGYLNFNASNVNPLNNANRAAALSVRCVQHLQGLFFYLSDDKNSFRPGVAVGYGSCQCGRIDSAIRRPEKPVLRKVSNS